jgi:hypothetical protein
MPEKKKQSSRLNLKQYRIYGIINIKTKELAYVNLIMQVVEDEYDIEGYNPSEYSIVYFDVIVS